MQPRQQTSLNNSEFRRTARLAGITGDDYTKLVQGLTRLQSNANPNLLPPPVRDVVNRYWDMTQNLTQRAATSGGQRFFKNLPENIEVGNLNENFDPPMMMVLKRKAIRVFPDGQRVALYVNEKLGLNFTVPYSSSGTESSVVSTMQSEEFTVETVKMLAEKNNIDDIHLASQAIIGLYNALNPTNQNKMKNRITDPDNFRRILSLAKSHHKKNKKT